MAFVKKDFIETLYEQAEYYDTVKNTILYVMKSHGGINDYDLQDCISEVFLTALKKRREVKEHPSVKGWLNLAAKNIARRFIKSRTIQSMLFSDTDEGMPEVIDTDDDYQKLCVEFFDSLKTDLKPFEYKLYDMKFNKKRSIDDIAEEFGKSKHAIEIKISRLKEKVRKNLYDMRI